MSDGLGLVLQGLVGPARPVGRLGPVRAVVAERGVEVAPTVVVRAPGDRVLVRRRGAVLLLVGVLVEGEEHVDVLGLLREVVPLVLADPRVRDAGGGGVLGVLDVHRRRLELEAAGRVVGEPGAAHHVAVPGPVAIRVGRRVDADDAAAALDPALERVALRRREGALAVRVVEDHDLVVAEPLVGEDGRVLAACDAEVLRLAHLRHRGMTGLDGSRVPEARRLREDEHVIARVRRLCGRRRDAPGQHDGQHEHETENGPQPPGTHSSTPPP